MPRVAVTVLAVLVLALGLGGVVALTDSGSAGAVGRPTDAGTPSDVASDPSATPSYWWPCPDLRPPPTIRAGRVHHAGGTMKVRIGVLPGGGVGLHGTVRTTVRGPGGVHLVRKVRTFSVRHLRQGRYTLHIVYKYRQMIGCDRKLRHLKGTHRSTITKWVRR